MTRVFVDTSFFFAYYYEKDPHHERACDVIARLPEIVPDRQPQLILTDYVFDELVTLVLRAMSKTDAIEIGQRLLHDRSVDFQSITSSHFHEAWKIFQGFGDKQWSFTDCASYVWIRDHRPDYCLSTDDDFRQFGLVPNLMGS